jgi:hypothetical protein
MDPEKGIVSYALLRSCAPALLRSCAPALLRSCAPALQFIISHNTAKATALFMFFIPQKESFQLKK